MTTITRNIRPIPIDRRAVLDAQDEMKRRIYVFGLYSEDMAFTLQEVVKAFGYRRDKAWTQIQRLMREGLVRSAGVRDKNRLYQIATKENSLCQ